mgnify:CR=1 FL=1
MCVSPIDGWRSAERSVTGKRAVVFDLRRGLHDRPVIVPCGRCIECRLRKKREWALRCQHEASLHDENTLLVLTYDDEHLPALGSLRKAHLSSFLKRLRSRSGKRFKFFACGEYGGRFDRPHYHVLLFGLGFPDKVPGPERNGYKSWNSEVLDATWAQGITEIGEVTFDGIAYVAKYITKKDDRDEGWLRAHGYEPEFIHMSRGGAKDRDGVVSRGIGYDWWKQFGNELLQHDSVLLKGKEVSVPRYYDGLNETSEPEEVQKIKAARQRCVDADEMRTPRLMSREKVLESADSLFTGGSR